ncbi:hypothetical protein I4641_23375 [Waterburya agarophytonicola K14]|uniref:Uncharacterized protein n=1 Tax=Waterburya agarophytonicola KI4 TaxID=2874699 RepID=A0A964C010_9CYAN|nr:hypothetical protein [Waterburya agarophytonicola]MCC0179882.1 hypothetical protein [Waterburya agarophytonicola KI4]
MVRLNSSPTPCFWNCIGIAIAILSVGGAINISRTKTLEIELAQYKLKTSNAISKVQKVSNTLEKVSNTSPIATPKRREIEQQLSESNEILERAFEEIDQDTKQLIDTELEK